MTCLSPEIAKYGVFITFPGNCGRALEFYHTVFGGDLVIDTYNNGLPGFTGKPVVTGSLISGKICIQGSDMVHEGGRRVGNYMSIFLRCDNHEERAKLIKQLTSENASRLLSESQHLFEFVDVFEVRWLLAV